MGYLSCHVGFFLVVTDSLVVVLELQSMWASVVVVGGLSCCETCGILFPPPRTEPTSPVSGKSHRYSY